jgi:hypothetical protein
MIKNASATCDLVKKVWNLKRIGGWGKLDVATSSSSAPSRRAKKRRRIIIDDDEEEEE